MPGVNLESVDALLKDKTRTPGTPPIPPEKNRLFQCVCQEQPKDTSRWTAG
jgi:hypothetical protein